VGPREGGNRGSGRRRPAVLTEYGIISRTRYCISPFQQTKDGDTEIPSYPMSCAGLSPQTVSMRTDCVRRATANGGDNSESRYFIVKFYYYYYLHRTEIDTPNSVLGISGIPIYPGGPRKKLLGGAQRPPGPGQNARRYRPQDAAPAIRGQSLDHGGDRHAGGKPGAREAARGSHRRDELDHNRSYTIRLIMIVMLCTANGYSGSSDRGA
jgi:hypothetical protein